MGPESTPSSVGGIAPVEARKLEDDLQDYLDDRLT